LKRFYNESESNSSAPFIVLGFDIAKVFFWRKRTIGKNIRLYGQRFTVIGMLKKRRDVWG
jgi:putative ABC transport system permease protein